MALYEITGPDGAIYEIEGPEGATDEQLVSAVRRQIRDEERAQLQARLEETRRPVERVAPQEDAGFVENVLSGLGAGAAGLYEYAALGAATALNEGDENEARRIIQEAADSITPEGGDKDSITYQIAQGVGSILGLAPAAILGPLGIIPAGAVAMAAGAGEASERAREEGATEEERATASLKGVGIGATEIIPLGRVFKAFKMPFLQDLIDKVGPDAVRDGGSRIANAAATGGVEAAQETAAELLQNLTERGYNPDQEIVEGLAGAAGIGGASGAIVDLMVNAFVKKGSKGTPEPSDELLALPPPTPELEQGAGRIGALAEPVTLPDGSVATTAEELAQYEQARLSRTALPAPQTEEELIAEGNFEEIARRRALAERRQGDLFGQEQQPPTRLTPQEEQELDALGAELGLTQEQIDEFKARQGELFEGQAPSPQAVPRLEGPPSEQELVSQGDFEAIARRREQEAVEADRRQQVEQEAEATRRAQAVEQAQRVEGEQRIRDRQLAEAGRPMAEEQARRRLADEQEMFPLERERAQAEPARPEQPARYMDQQPDLEGVEPRQEAEARRQREEQGELFGPRGGVRRQAPAPVPAPRETRGPTQQELLPREEPEQGELLGPRGGARRRAEFEAQQPQRRPATETRDVEAEPRIVTKKVMSDLGIPAAAPVRKRIEGRDMSVPEDAQVIRSQLTEFSNNPNVTQGTKFKITKFLEGAPDGQMEMFDARQRVRPEAQAPEPQQVEGQADVEPREPEAEPVGVGVQARRPSAQRRQAEPEPTRAARTEAPQQERLESAERDTTDVADREGTKRDTLKPKAKAKPKPKSAKVLEKVKELPKAVPAVRKKPKAPAPAKSTTTAEEVKTKTTTQTAPVSTKKPKAKKVTAERTPMRVATEADQKLKDAQDKVIPNTLSALFNYKFRKVGTAVAKDTDKTTVASLLERVADPIKSKLNKKEPKNAARFYFGKKARIEDTLELVAHDLAFGGMGKSAYQATTRGNLGKLAELEDVTSEAENAFFEGLGNAEVARAAQSWIVGNMSPEVVKKLQRRASYYAEMALNIDRMKNRDLVAEERELDATRADLQKKVEKQATKKEDTLDKKTTRELEQAFGEGTLDESTTAYVDIIDNLARLRDGLDLPTDAVAASSTPLHPEVSIALEEGNLGKALQYIASTTLNTRVRNAALKLAEAVGTTKVEVVENLEEAGNFNPENNTIQLNADTGMNVHTVLHEVTHAGTSATLANKSHPMTKQLTNLFESVKDELGSAYGTTSLDEFVAEAFSNPEFRMQLAALSPKGDKFTALERFLNAVGNFLRKIFGMQTKPLGSALKEADRMIENILAPAPESRDAGKLLLISREGPQAIRDFVNGYGARVNEITKGIRDSVSKDNFLKTAFSFFESGTGKGAKAAKAVGLMAMPSQALADIMGKYKIPAMMDLHKLFEKQEGEMSQSDQRLDAELKQLGEWINANPDKKDTFNKLVHQSTIDQIDPTDPRSEYSGDDLARYDELKRMLDEIGPDGRKQYIELRDTYARLFDEMKKVVEGRIDGLVDADGNDISAEAKAELRNRIFAKMFDKARIKPYFPLTRKGDFWLKFNVKTAEGTEPVVRAFETEAERRDAIEELSSMPEVLKKDNGEPDIEIERSPSKFKFGGAASTSFVGQTMSILNANGVDQNVKDEFLRLFIDTLPETSFAKSLAKRKGTLGYNEDAMLAFRLKAFDIGRQAVRLKYSRLIRNSMDNAREQIESNKDLRNSDLRELFTNEVEERGNFAMNPPADPIAIAARNANRIAFLGTIGFNLSSAIVNLSQVPLVVLPYMAGKTSYRDATRNLNAARRFFMGAGREHSVMVNGKPVKAKSAIPSIDNYYDLNEDGTMSIRADLELDADQRKMAELMLPLVQASARRGLLNRSMFYDSLGIEQGGKEKSWADTLNAWSAFPFHTAERFNRQITLAGTYLNELQRLTEANNKLPEGRRRSEAEIQQEAVDIALYDTQQTNGGAVLATAARVAQMPLGRVAMMYKGFGIQMYYTQFKTAKEAIYDSDLTPEQKKIAMRQIMGIQGSVLLMSGVQGLTMFGIVAGIANLFLDDDEEDFETITRGYLGEALYKGGVNQILDGLGIEVDVASRIGLSNLIIASNRYNFDPSMEKTIVQTLGGPAYGYLSQVARGVGDVMDGEVQRGIENILPSALRNAAKATFRYSDEGILTRRKDPILDDLNAAELTAQFFGFAPAEYTLNQERNQVLKRVEKSINTQRTKLLRQYYIALRTGDREGIRDITAEMVKFNKRNPSVSITSDSIRRSMKQHMKTSARMYNGVTLSPKLRTSLMEIAEDFEQDAPWFMR